MRKSVLGALLSATIVAVGSCSDPSGGEDSGGPAVAPPNVFLAPPSAGPEPTPADVRFLAVGDTGTANVDSEHVARLAQAWCEVERCDFILMLGDNAYPAGITSVEDPLWMAAVEIPWISLGIPIRPVLGNHDYGANGDDFTRGQTQVDYSAIEPLWQMPAEHYAFGDARAAFVVLDTSQLLFDVEGSAIEQAELIRGALAEADPAAWRIAAGHFPYRSNGDHGNAGEYDGKSPGSLGSGKHLAPFYENEVCGRFDLLLTAHDHSLQVLPADDVCATPLVVSGAGGMSGNVYERQPSLFMSEGLGFAYVIAAPERLEVRMIGPAGTVEHVSTFERLPR